MCKYTLMYFNLKKKITTTKDTFEKINKNENELKTLREERKALEDVILSLRKESDELKKNLANEIAYNENSKSQVNCLTSKLKENDQVLSI